MKINIVKTSNRVAIPVRIGSQPPSSVRHNHISQSSQGVMKQPMNKPTKKTRKQDRKAAKATAKAELRDAERTARRHQKEHRENLKTLRHEQRQELRSTPRSERRPAKKQQKSELKATKAKAKAQQRADKKAVRAKVPHRKLKVALTVLLFIAFGGLLAFAGYKIFEHHQDDVESYELQEEAIEVADVQEVAEEGELINPPEDVGPESDYWYYIHMPFTQADFSVLKAKNADTVAYIHMNNSNVNYPVVQTGDNVYYLTHAYDHSYNESGWVFMDYRASFSPLSDNVVIYGHGRWEGTVFGTLKNALSPSWQSNRDNYVITISTPTDNFMYQIFSVYVVKAESYYIQTAFGTPEAKMAWLETMKSRNVTPVDVPLSANDSILTLSTCLNDNNDDRIVVQAKLIKRQAR